MLCMSKLYDDYIFSFWWDYETLTYYEFLISYVLFLQRIALRQRVKFIVKCIRMI